MREFQQAFINSFPDRPFTVEDRIAFFYGAPKVGKTYYAMDHVKPDYREDLVQTNNLAPGEKQTLGEYLFDSIPEPSEAQRDIWLRAYNESAERRHPSRSPVAKAKAKERNRKAAKAARKARRK